MPVIGKNHILAPSCLDPPPPPDPDKMRSVVPFYASSLSPAVLKITAGIRQWAQGNSIRFTVQCTQCTPTKVTTFADHQHILYVPVSTQQA